MDEYPSLLGTTCQSCGKTHNPRASKSEYCSKCISTFTAAELEQRKQQHEEHLKRSQIQLREKLLGGRE